MEVETFYLIALTCWVAGWLSEGRHRHFAVTSFFYWCFLILWWPMLETSPENYWHGYAALDGMMAVVLFYMRWSRVVAVALGVSALMYFLVWLEPRGGRNTYHLYEINALFDKGVAAIYVTAILWPWLAAVGRHFYQKAVQRR